MGTESGFRMEKLRAVEVGPPRTMVSKTYDPVERCVYCHSIDEPLTREHIIPFGIGGRLVLPRASCEACACKTKKFERVVQQEMLGAIRVRFGLRGRPRKYKRTHRTIGAFHGPDGAERSIPETVRLEHYPGVVHFMRYNLPGLFRDLFGEKFKAEHWLMTADESNPVAAKLSPHRKLRLAGYRPLHFTKLLAKIGHCCAVAKYGLERVRPTLTDYIRGDNDSDSLVFRYIGGELNVPPADPELHKLEIWTVKIKDETIILVKVRLFAFLGAPIYYVIPGFLIESGDQEIGTVEQ